jgi:hypothetical protein
MMQSEAEEGVIEVIPPRDRREHSLNGLLSGLSGPLGHHPAS